jgi:HYR domain
MFKRTLAIAALVLTAAAVLLEFAPATPADSGSLHVSIAWTGQDVPCPAGYSATTLCHLRAAGPVAVPGFGFVSQSYVFAAETATQPSCPASQQKALSYPATLTVKQKGELFLSVAGSDKCLSTDTTEILDVTQTFTVTGGSGVFAGASGSGTLTRTDTGFGAHGFGVDHWDGTLVAPNYVPDVTPPTIKGAHNRLLHAPRGVKRLRVRYRVTALDNADGALRPTCRPRSGSRFRVGRRTTVRCSVSDRSANVSGAKFKVLVRRTAR